MDLLCSLCDQYHYKVKLRDVQSHCVIERRAFTDTTKYLKGESASSSPIENLKHVGPCDDSLLPSIRALNLNLVMRTYTAIVVVVFQTGYTFFVDIALDLQIYEPSSPAHD